jgi:hypothetical protein
MTKEQIIRGPTDCFDTNGKKQLTNPFDAGGSPADPEGPCVFNVLVCSVDSSSLDKEGIVERWRSENGLDV